MLKARERRLALNEVVFREANERMDAWAGRRDAEGPVSYYCECSDIDCHERIFLHVADYQDVRTDPSHFVVAPGHETHDIETVVERSKGYVVVEKGDRFDPIVEDDG